MTVWIIGIVAYLLGFLTAMLLRLSAIVEAERESYQAGYEKATADQRALVSERARKAARARHRER